MIKEAGAAASAAEAAAEAAADGVKLPMTILSKRELSGWLRNSYTVSLSGSEDVETVRSRIKFDVSDTRKTMNSCCGAALIFRITIEVIR